MNKLPMSTTQITFFPRSNRLREQPGLFTNAKPLLFLAMLIICIGIIVTYRQHGAPDIKMLLASTDEEIPGPKTLPDLANAITEIIQKEEGEYSVLFSDHKSSDYISVNHKSAYTAASVIKIPLLAAIYQLADAGEISLDEEITILRSDVQDWGTGTIRYESQPIRHTVREICQLLIEKSDNTAAYVITNRIIGPEKIQQIISRWGLSQTNVAENLTSNQDIEKLMRMMFDGKIADEKLTAEMISWMDDSDYENRLSGLLPESVNVYHKIGNEVRIIHDVGVIEFDGHRYYLGILSREVPDLERAERTIGTLSKTVYDYVRSKK